MIAKVTVASKENPREVNEIVFNDVDEVLHIEDRAKRIKLLVKKNQKILGTFFTKDIRLVRVESSEEEGSE